MIYIMRRTYKLYILYIKYILIKFKKKYYSYNIIQIIFNFIYLKEIIFLIFKIFSLLKDYRCNIDVKDIKL